MVLGLGVTIGEELFEGYSWTLGVLLNTTVGVGLLSCVCVLCSTRICQVGNVHVTREPEDARQPSGMSLRCMRIKIINHAKEKTWSLSWYSGDQLSQLMESNALCGRDTWVQFSQHVASTNENQTQCSCDDRVWCGFFDLGCRW